MTTQVMGIVSVAPESAFGGDSADPAGAVALGRTLVAAGADVLDVSAVSTSEGVDEATEAAVVLPVVEALAGEVAVWVGTTSASTAEAAVGVGASAISDPSGKLLDLAARLGVGWEVTHRPGRAADRLGAAAAVRQTLDFLVTAARRATSAGVGSVWINPGLGGERTPAHSFALLANIGELVSTGYPVLVSASRDPFLGSEPETSLAAATWAMSAGVAIVRVHDVAGAVAARSVVTGEPVAVASW